MSPGDEPEPSGHLKRHSGRNTLSSRFRAGGPGGPGRPGARAYFEDYAGQEEGFDGHEDMGRAWDNGGRHRPHRGAGPPRGERSLTSDGLTQLDQNLMVQTGNSRLMSAVPWPGHESYRDNQQVHEGSSSGGRERPSSMQGMDMASLPPRKRPWQDGPGTGDLRELDPPCSDGGERCHPD